MFEAFSSIYYTTNRAVGVSLLGAQNKNSQASAAEMVSRIYVRGELEPAHTSL